MTGDSMASPTLPQLALRVFHRFETERLALAVGALSSATMLGLVPMIIIAATIIHQLPFAANIGPLLEKFLLANLLPEKAGTVIAEYVHQFADRAEGFTWFGILTLLASAIIQMLTIEHAFEAIWHTKAPRGYMRRLATHIFTLLLGPLIFGGSLAAVTYLASISLGLIPEVEWLSSAVFRALSFATLALLFALVYRGGPNRVVASLDALAGGMLAAACFLAMQKLFGLYIAYFPTYTLIYGAFAALPIFLVWLYASWMVILVGALVTAELSRGADADCDERL